MSRRRRSGRQETAPTSTDEERRCVGLFDRQSRHWNTKVLVMVAIIVVVAAVIRVGHYSRRMEAASRKKHDPREGHNQAKAVLRARSLSLSLFPALANCNANPSRCNVFCRRVDDPVRIVPRQEIRPAIISSPNASTVVTQLFQLFYLRR